MSVVAITPHHLKNTVRNAVLSKADSFLERHKPNSPYAKLENAERAARILHKNKILAERTIKTTKNLSLVMTIMLFFLNPTSLELLANKGYLS